MWPSVCRIIPAYLEYLYIPIKGLAITLHDCPRRTTLMNAIGPRIPIGKVEGIPYERSHDLVDSYDYEYVPFLNTTPSSISRLWQRHFTECLLARTLQCVPCIKQDMLDLLYHLSSRTWEVPFVFFVVLVFVFCLFNVLICGHCIACFCRS